MVPSFRSFYVLNIHKLLCKTLYKRQWWVSYLHCHLSFVGPTRGKSLWEESQRQAKGRTQRASRCQLFEAVFLSLRKVSWIEDWLLAAQSFQTRTRMFRGFVRPSVSVKVLSFSLLAVRNWSHCYTCKESGDEEDECRHEPTVSSLEENSREEFSIWKEKSSLSSLLSSCWPFFCSSSSASSSLLS